MAARLVRWARAVKARQGRRHPGASIVPPLWLFTDAARLPDPLPAIGRLPRGLCGVVLRHDGAIGRAALGRQAARLCRARGLALVVAGDGRLARALGAGLHLRDGRRPGGLGLARRRGCWVTGSAHDAAALRRARRAGADAAFLSPAFPTASHPGARALGPVRWAALAQRAGLPTLALGGVDGATALRLARSGCAGAGAIGALLPSRHSVSQ